MPHSTAVHATARAAVSAMTCLRAFPRLRQRTAYATQHPSLEVQRGLGCGLRDDGKAGLGNRRWAGSAALAVREEEEVEEVVPRRLEEGIPSRDAPKRAEEHKRPRSRSDITSVDAKRKSSTILLKPGFASSTQESFRNTQLTYFVFGNSPRSRSRGQLFLATGRTPRPAFGHASKNLEKKNNGRKTAASASGAACRFSQAVWKHRINSYRSRRIYNSPSIDHRA